MPVRLRALAGVDGNCNLFGSSTFSKNWSHLFIYFFIFFLAWISTSLPVSSAFITDPCLVRPSIHPSIFTILTSEPHGPAGEPVVVQGCYSQTQLQHMKHVSTGSLHLPLCSSDTCSELSELTQLVEIKTIGILILVWVPVEMRPWPVVTDFLIKIQNNGSQIYRILFRKTPLSVLWTGFSVVVKWHPTEKTY